MENYMDDDTRGMLERFSNYNTQYVRKIRSSRKSRWLFSVNPKYKRLYEECETAESLEEKNAALAAIVNVFQEGFLWRGKTWIDCIYEDIKVFLRQHGNRKTIDRSGSKEDYYSVAVIVKNEARYIKEYILFYMATGADRIYLYDNDSDDNLMEVLEPFIKSGFVVYRKWAGHVVQTAAYRDAVRRTRRRTKWLALIDADEFLFSPKGSMPEQLKNYEKYPGIGVNWVMFGPNGHITRPKGLVMDNYTVTEENYDNVLNWHIKSIVQPKMVFSVFHPHYAVYKGKTYAVNEKYEILDNTSTRAFSIHNSKDVFRINHYSSKSFEDLKEKSKRGFPDGSPSIDYGEARRTYEEFDGKLIEDYEIKKYADIVRGMYGDY